MEESRQAQVNEGATKSQEKLESDTRAYSEAKSNTFSKSRDFIKNIAERSEAGKNVNYEAMGEQSENVQQRVSTTKSLVKDYVYGTVNKVN